MFLCVRLQRHQQSGSIVRDQDSDAQDARSQVRTCKPSSDTPAAPHPLPSGARLASPSRSRPAHPAALRTAAPRPRDASCRLRQNTGAQRGDGDGQHLRGQCLLRTLLGTSLCPLLLRPVRLTSVCVCLKIRDEWGNQIWICPGCNKPDDGSPMIGCDDCDDWYHW